MEEKTAIFWFRRDLRLNDNCGLFHALKDNPKVMLLFIFDTYILEQLEDQSDKRVQFIYNSLSSIQKELVQHNSSILIKTGEPVAVWTEIISSNSLSAVYTNHDYEPYAIERDKKVKDLLINHNIPFSTYKDQVIFEKDEVLNESGKPYTVFTPYKNKWLSRLKEKGVPEYPSEKLLDKLIKTSFPFPSLPEVGFWQSDFSYPPKTVDDSLFINYEQTRDFPSVKGTSRLGIHLRFGTISIRKLVRHIEPLSATFLSELIWREFYMMILLHFPFVVNHNFRKKFDNLKWRNDESEFKRWCNGETGYPLVDAGIREMNASGFMHNRVRMIAASFLTKHLLIDWRWGEAYFAQKLLDYELASNNGNWQWVAGCGTDAAPYFRIFNPEEQLRKFDPELKYVKMWVPELESPKYALPIIDHKFARERALKMYAQL